MDKILCTICARGGSKGVKNKNIIPINNKPLIAYTIEQAKQSDLFDHIVISTDSDEIASISTQYGAEVFFKRDDSMANDTAGKLCVIKDALIKSEEHYKQQFDVLVDLDATSPLRNVEDILDSYKQFKEKNNDNLITATPSRRSPYFNMIEFDKNNCVRLSKNLDKGIKRRQDSPKTYDMNASIYIWKRDTLLNESTLFLPKTGVYIMPEDRSLDIDSKLDLKIVEFLLKERDAKK